tara:strand:+ start:2173 stop:2559 length:387 start_codon:yes stop_codon:yes gene_type:complete
MQQDPFQRELGNPTIQDPTDHGAEIYCIDIDGTLTYPHVGTPWDAKPRLSRIAKINDMYDKGAIIYLQTARGWISSKGDAQEADRLMRPMTEEQLKEWGVKYTSLHFGKPRARVYVDDRGVSDTEFFR